MNTQLFFHYQAAAILVYTYFTIVKLKWYVEYSRVATVVVQRAVGIMEQHQDTNLFDL